VKQLQVYPRLVGWSGDWAFEEAPRTHDGVEHRVARELGEKLDIHPYARTTIAALGADDEGRVFVYRGGQLLAEPRGPQGLPDWLDRGEGEPE